MQEVTKKLIMVDALLNPVCDGYLESIQESGLSKELISTALDLICDDKAIAPILKSQVTNDFSLQQGFSGFAGFDNKFEFLPGYDDVKKIYREVYALWKIYTSVSPSKYLSIDKRDAVIEECLKKIKSAYAAADSGSTKEEIKQLAKEIRTKIKARLTQLNTEIREKLRQKVRKFIADFSQSAPAEAVVLVASVLPSYAAAFSSFLIPLLSDQRLLRSELEQLHSQEKLRLFIRQIIPLLAANPTREKIVAILSELNLSALNQDTEDPSVQMFKEFVVNRVTEKEERKVFSELRLETIALNDCTIEGVDFSDCCFDKFDFTGVTFKNCNFLRTNFSSGIFDNCTFDDCKWERSTFDKCTFNQVSFEKSSFDKVDIKNTSFIKVKFSKSYLISTYVFNEHTTSPIKDLSFDNSLLSNVVFSGVKSMANIIFTRSVLKGLAVNNCECSAFSIIDARLSVKGCSFENSTLMDWHLSNSNFEELLVNGVNADHNFTAHGIKVTNGKIIQSNLSGAVFTGGCAVLQTNFEYFIAKDANFSGVTFEGGRICLASLDRSSFCDSSFVGMKLFNVDMTGANLDKLAVFACKAILVNANKVTPSNHALIADQKSFSGFSYPRISKTYTFRPLKLSGPNGETLVVVLFNRPGDRAGEISQLREALELYENLPKNTMDDVRYKEAKDILEIRIRELEHAATSSPTSPSPRAFGV